MSDLSVEQKVKLASQFIIDSPPGEFHEVLNDIRVLVQNDVKLQSGAKAQVYRHNIEQFIVTELDNDTKAIISKYSELDDENTFYCPSTKQKFSFDHVRQQASNVEPYQLVNESKTRPAIEEEIKKYVSEHYPDGVCGVYDYNNNNTIVILIVSNKYNPQNFWNGRWRSEWSYEPSSGSLKGTLRANVHYYEDGNVQFTSEHQETLTNISNSSELKQKILEAEAKYQNSLNENYAQMSETTFKGLRRALPVTKSKVDWNKVSKYGILSYKVGSNISR